MTTLSPNSLTGKETAQLLLAGDEASLSRILENIRNGNALSDAQLALIGGTNDMTAFLIRKNNPRALEQMVAAGTANDQTHAHNYGINISVREAHIIRTAELTAASGSMLSDQVVNRLLEIDDDATKNALAAHTEAAQGLGSGNWAHAKVSASILISTGGDQFHMGVLKEMMQRGYQLSIGDRIDIQANIDSVPSGVGTSWSKSVLTLDGQYASGEIVPRVPQGVTPQPIRSVAD